MAVTESAFRSRKAIRARPVGQPHVGEKAVEIRVPVIGLRSSFSPSVTANAAADAPSRPMTTNEEMSRANAARF